MKTRLQRYKSRFSKRGFTNLLVRVLPKDVLKSLAKSMTRYDEELVTRTVRPSHRKWDTNLLPERVSGFEDLTFLFWTTPLNRNVLMVDFDEAAALYKLVKGLPSNAQGVEIGRMVGGSTVLIAAALAHSGGRLVSIDVAPRNDEQLRLVLSQLGLAEHVELIVADSNCVELAEPLDFVFIDGRHSYSAVKCDHLRWGRLVKAGGYVIHHDMGNSRPNATCKPALSQLKRDIVHHQGKELELVQEVGSLVIFRRVSDAWTAF